jgi:hypothetical protein
MLLFVADAVGREKLARIVFRTGQTVPFFALNRKGRRKRVPECHFDTAITAFDSTG